MAQPTVVYPPWLTPIPSVLTDAAGAPIATETSVSYIPPVYYGPSVGLTHIEIVSNVNQAVDSTRFIV